MNSRFHAFREQFKTFSYKGLEIQPSQGSLNTRFDFEIDGTIRFQPRMAFPEPPEGWRIDPTGPLATKLAFSVGMVETLSYWKSYCPKRLSVEAGGLGAEEVAWWQKLYYLGLGEFCHRNGIEADPADFVKIVPEDGGAFVPVRLEQTKSNLIPVGGGKDSIVSLETMRPFQRDSKVVLLNAPRSARRCAEIAGYQGAQIVEVRRTLDPRLLELNTQGALNGHTPFSALLAFSSLFMAVLGGSSRILLSNESSANEPTVLGSHVNHQYSKSFEFEEDFRRYVARFITPDVEYLSLLRPLNELQIAATMSRYPQYLNDFRSCNVGSKEDRWCGKCPKCLFTFVMLQPFQSTERLAKIFGHDLLDEPALEDILMELLGCAETKPFECVGTVAEVRAAVSLIIDQQAAQPKTRRLLERVKAQQPGMLVSPEAAASILNEWNTQHHLSAALEARLREVVSAQP